MRLATFRARGESTSLARCGLVEGARVYEVEGRPQMVGLLQAGPAAWGRVKAAGTPHPLVDVVLSAPIPRPGKIIAAIVNTRGMLGGTDVELDRPRLDMKAPSCVIGPGETILAPRGGIRPEVELAAVVGRALTRVSPDEARNGIFGYTVLNDITAPKDSKDDAYEAYRRDRGTGQIRKVTMRGPLFRSKNHDTFCPMGPWVVTLDEIGDAKGLRMSTRFGTLAVQEGSTDEYLFSPERLVSYVSQFLTLEAGDVVSCGSVGWTREAVEGLDATEYVLPSMEGVLELEIEKVGALRNPVRPG